MMSQIHGVPNIPNVVFMFRLTIDYHHNLHQPQLALEAAISGLRESQYGSRLSND